MSDNTPMTETSQAVEAVRPLTATQSRALKELAR